MLCVFYVVFYGVVLGGVKRGVLLTVVKCLEETSIDTDFSVVNV
jgi:hypothetical protein